MNAADHPVRRYRVHLMACEMTTIEVDARTATEAERLAYERSAAALPNYRTEPAPFKADVCKLIDPLKPEEGFKWVRLDRVYLGKYGGQDWTYMEKGDAPPLWCERHAPPAAGNPLPAK